LICVKADKEALRRRMRALRARMKASERKQLSQQAIERFRQWWQQHAPQGADLLCYRAFGDELATDALFSDPPTTGVYAPVVLPDGAMQWRRANGARWRAGRFGIPEPDGEPWDAERAAVVVCPLVAFDRTGARLGMGMGYFDRWLAAMRSHEIVPVGLAFSVQEVDRVPVEPHDAPLFWIITDKETIRCR